MKWSLSSGLDEREAYEEIGSRFLIGNGYLGVRGTLDEHERGQLVGITLAGIYDQVGDGWREPLNAPNPFWSKLWLKDTLLTLDAQTISDHHQWLDFRYASQNRKSSWQCESGKVTLETMRYADINKPNLLYYKIKLSSDFNTRLKLVTGIDGRVWDINGPHYKKIECRKHQEYMVSIGHVQGSDDQVFVGRKDYTLSSQALKETCISDDTIQNHYVIDIEADKPFLLESVISISTSKDSETPLAIIERNLQSRPLETYASHKKGWNKIWARSEVQIIGDDEAEKSINYSIYQLNIAAPRHHEFLSIPARALSGQVYKGAIFWDTEMFMLDYFLWSQPKIAKSLINYRIKTLNGALAKAREYGYEGAFYPWEGQDGGYDACSDYNVIDVFTERPVRTYFKDKQVHISSAVVRAIDYYLHVTGESNILLEGALEVVIECALFYRSLLVKKIDGKLYEIHDVIGPDEYHERVNNNAYTNYMAAYTIEIAIQLYERVENEYPNHHEVMEGKLGLSEKIRNLKAVAKAIYLPQANENLLLEQFDGYFKLENTLPAIIRKRLKHPKEYWGGGTGIASDTQVIKQADVLTLMEVRRELFSEETIEKNWHYYEARTEHGSSLSACMYALTACRFKRPDLAYPFFMKSAQSDLISGGKQWAGLVYIGGTHPASAGGAWKSLVQGFLGLEKRNGQVHFNPQFPKHWEKVVIKLNSSEGLKTFEFKRSGLGIDILSKETS